MAAIEISDEEAAAQGLRLGSWLRTLADPDVFAAATPVPEGGRHANSGVAKEGSGLLCPRPDPEGWTVKKSARRLAHDRN